MLEPDEGKLSSPVLRGLSGRDAARLPGEANGTTVSVSLDLGSSLSIQPSEGAARGCGGPGCYGNSINLSLKSLARRGLGQNDVIDFQHIAVLTTICVTLPPAPSVFQEDSSGAGVYTRGSARRASGCVLTVNPSRATFREAQRESTEPLCINVVSL